MQDLKHSIVPHIPEGIRTCKNPKCGKELPTSAHKNKQFCDECAYEKIKTRSRKNYHFKKGWVQARSYIQRSDLKYLKQNCFDVAPLIRRLVSDFVEQSKIKENQRT